MGDTKRDRENQARDEERRQREGALEQDRGRVDEESEPPRPCHRRGCDETATFHVLERYEEETGHGAVEATADLCRAHAAEEHPTNLDGVYPDYVFRVEPIETAGDAA